MAGCPKNIVIPEVFAIYNDFQKYGSRGGAMMRYMDAAVAMTEKIIAENKVAATDKGEYQRCRNELVIRYESAKDGYERVSGEISDRQGKRKVYTRFIGELQRLDGFGKGFDEELWTALLDYATVYTKDDIRSFKAGNEVKVTG